MSGAVLIGGTQPPDQGFPSDLMAAPFDSEKALQRRVTLVSVIVNIYNTVSAG